MEEIQAALKAQKELGDKLRARRDSYKQLALERRNYEYVRRHKQEDREFYDQFITNDEFLKNNPLMDKKHEYYEKAYFKATTDVYNDLLNIIQETIDALETENPDLRTQYDQMLLHKYKGDQLNLDEIFRGAQELKDASMTSETSSGRMGVFLQRLASYVKEYRKAETENDADKARLIASGIKSYSRIMEVQCDVINAPNCNINHFFDLTEEVGRIIGKYENPAGGDTSKWNTSAKLPKLNVPTFYGEHIKFNSFKELFEKMIGAKQNLDDCEKFAYLQGQLKGEPLHLISALPIENASYDLAWKKLKERYENNHIILVQLMGKIKTGPSIEKYNIASLKKITDEISESVSRIANMGITMDGDMDIIFYYLIEGRIDSASMNLYQNKMDKAGALRSYKDLMEFLQLRIKLLTVEETKHQTKHNNVKKPVRFIEFKKNDSTNHRTALNATINEKAGNGTKSCTKLTQCDCKERHPIMKCPRFSALKFTEKIRQAQKWRICTNCLDTTHAWRDCKLPNGCRKCTAKHHTVMHIDKVATTLLGTAVKNGSPEHVFLATAIIEVVGSSGEPYNARALLDSGAQINLMTTKLCNKIKAKHNDVAQKINGIGTAKIQSTKRASFVIKSKASGFQAHLEAFVLKEVSTTQPTNMVNIKSWKIPANIKLADPKFNVPADIDLIIGGELFFKLLSVGMISIGKSLPDLQNTVFGWVVTGKVLGLQQNDAFVGIAETQLEKQVAQFWQVEERFQDEKVMSKQELDSEEYFDRTTMRDGNTGKFIVNLQFLKEPSVLGDSKTMAIRRFLFLERRFDKDSELKNEYVTFLREYERLGHMEEVPFRSVTNENYFIPHHAVRNPSSSTTKFRVVFDGSAKTTSGTALNEILANGPMLQEDLFSILVRFRTHPIVVTADITKMYRQVEVTESHQKWQMIVWRENPSDPLRFYKLKTLTYGLTCSSYLAIKALQTLADEYKNVYPNASTVMKRDFNVDDVMTGTDNVQTALQLQQQLIEICKQGHFELHKWCSNHPLLLEAVPKNKQEVSLDINAEKTETKALGIKWTPKTDRFMLSYVPNEHKKVTKRHVLSELAQLFDPLGFVNPVIVKAKIFMQEICRLKMDWDAALPVHMVSEWEQYRVQLKELSNVNLPRHMLITDPVDIQLHIFSDASERAYGSVAYLRSDNNNGERLVQLVCSKSRVSPLSPTTLPRLELCGALLSVQLAKKLVKSLGVNITSTTYWTDSEVVLSWIHSGGRYKTFVANRIATIQRNSSPENWKYVNTKINPADLVSRGVLPDKLLESKLWWEGPEFLKEDEGWWPEEKPAFITVPEEEKTIKTVLTAGIPEPHFIDKINHHNSLRTYLRVVAYVLRMKTENKHLRAGTALSVQELRAAMTAIIKRAQETCFGEELETLRKGRQLKKRFSNLTPVLDTEGIMRVGGRLHAAKIPFEQRHPILLPKDHSFTKLLCQHFHRDNMHAGPQALLAIMRQQYWPENGKKLAHDTVKQCVICAKSKPRMMSQIMGALPEERVTIARAFHNVHVDFAGPVDVHYTLRGKKTTKGYISIFVCCSTKAVHMEAAIDLSMDGFICCLKRFIARRGLPKKIISDNATNFKGVNNKLVELHETFADAQQQDKLLRYCQDHLIEWQFSPPRSPHFNGLAEAAVKSAKWHLRKMLHTARLTFDELSTVTAEVEAILNSRPLTPMSNDPNDLQPLTAGHFLIGGPMIAIEDRNIMTGPKTKIWYKMMSMRNEFWHRWSKEYLAGLQSKIKWKSERDNIQIGALVIIQEDNIAPLHWRMGRVTRLFKDDLGKVRVVELKTSVVKIPNSPNGKTRINNMVADTKIVRRAIHRICPLPVATSIISDAKAATDARPEQQPAISKQPNGNTDVPRMNQPNVPEVTEQPIEIEQLNANTIVEEVNAIPKPRGKLIKPSHGREPTTAVINDQKSQPIAKRTRSRMQRAASSIAAVAMVCLAFMNKASAEQCQYTTVNNSPGMYFENIGKLALTHDKWNILCVLHMDQLWNQTNELHNVLDQMQSICSKIKPPKICDTTRKQLLQQVTLLEEQSQLIQQFSHSNLVRKRRARSNSESESTLLVNAVKRSKRGWANIIGSGFKVVTGVMDNDDSEQIQQQVSELNRTYQHTMALINEQTTIQDITKNILKRDEVNIAQQFTVVHNEVLELRNITIENSHFDSLAVQMLTILENYRERINAIIDLITQVRHGHISTVLITPQQLTENLETMSSSIKQSLMIPGEGIRNNLVHLYKLMNAEISMGKENIVIRLTIPLIEREYYDMHHILPVPFHIQNTLRIIKVTSPYMCINKRQDKYYMLSQQEKEACKTFMGNLIICEQKHMMYNIYNGSANCEMAVFSHSSKGIPPKCETMQVSSQQSWSKLYAKNTYLFTMATRATFDIICENSATNCYAEGTGIIQLDSKCILQSSNYEIVPENDIKAGKINVLIPKINISEIFIETYSELNPILINVTKQADYQMNFLERAIEQQKILLQKPIAVDKHNIHHYTMLYVTLAIVLTIGIALVYFIIKRNKKHQQPLRQQKQQRPQQQSPVQQSRTIEFDS